MPLPVIAQGALIGGGVGAVLAAVRRSDAETGRAGRIVKSAAEGAIAGAAVGWAVQRGIRRTAAELLAGAPVVVDTVTELAQRYEPVVERYAELARDRAVDAYAAARPRVEDAVDVVRARALELRAS
jgi:hypothetical protein